MNSKNSNEPLCKICNDSGTINVIRRVQPEGYPFPVDMTDNILCECHKKKLFDKYNASLGMKPHERLRTFQDADLDGDNKLIFNQLQKFVMDIQYHINTGTWLYIFGDEDRAKKESKSAFGTGKSHLTHCIGNYLTENQIQAIYITEDKLFEEIKATYSRNADETESQVMYRFENVPVLLIDDLFKSKTTDWTEDKVFHLLNNRQVPGKVTIINSNYAPNRIHLTMPKNGGAISSRILESAIMIEMIGKDRRRAKAKERILDGV
jgi:DNA replication protein DnaC